MLRGADYLAIYGAVLSTAVAAWTIWRTKHRISVRAMPSFGTQPNGEDGNGYVIVIRNLSTVPVQIVELGIGFPGRRVGIRDRVIMALRYRIFSRIWWSYIGQGADLPVVIASGQSHRAWIVGELPAQLRDTAGNSPVVPWARDGLYRRIHGPRLQPPFK